MPVCDVNNKMQRPATLQTGPVLASADVAKRPVFYKDLAKFLEDLRTEKGWGQSQAADIAQRRGLTVATRQKILRLETGKTKNIDPEVLRAVADLYERPYLELVGHVVAERYGIDLASGRDLSRQIGELQRASHLSGGSDGPDPPRVQQLERRLQEYETLVGEMQDVAGRLFRLAALGKKGPSARRAQSQSGRRAGKTSE